MAWKIDKGRGEIIHGSVPRMHVPQALAKREQQREIMRLKA